MCLLFRFIETGSLADIKLGIQESVVQAKVGNPSDVITLSDGFVLWAYGYGLELYFENSELIKISVKYDFTLEIFRLPEYFGREGNGQLDGLSSLDSLINMLKDQEVDWSIHKDFTDDSTICLFCNDATYIYYNLDDHQILSIQSM